MTTKNKLLAVLGSLETTADDKTNSIQIHLTIEIIDLKTFLKVISLALLAD